MHARGIVSVIYAKHIAYLGCLWSVLFKLSGYSGTPIFRTSLGNGNWFEKSGVRKIEDGTKSRLIYEVMFYITIGKATRNTMALF